MDTIKTECEYRGIDFSNYIRYAATVAMKYSKAELNSPEPQQVWSSELYRRRRGTYSIQQSEQDRWWQQVDHNQKLD
jgi:hypothetical protein